MTGTMSGVRRPVPVPDASTRPFWEAAARGVLTVARCSRCERFTIPPDQICPHCGSTDPGFAFRPVSGRGTLRAWTVVRKSFLPGFDGDLPFVLADVELAEQAELRMIGRLLDGKEATLFAAAPVEVAFEEVAPGMAVPAFVLRDPNSDTAGQNDEGAGR
jgi:uncharacterized OB-fold protein